MFKGLDKRKMRTIKFEETGGRLKDVDVRKAIRKVMKNRKVSVKPSREPKND